MHCYTFPCTLIDFHIYIYIYCYAFLKYAHVFSRMSLMFILFSEISYQVRKASKWLLSTPFCVERRSRHAIDHSRWLPTILLSGRNTQLRAIPTFAKMWKYEKTFGHTRKYTEDIQTTFVHRNTSPNITNASPNTKNMCLGIQSTCKSV